MNDDELSGALDALDYIYQRTEPWKEFPNEELQERARDFVDFMSFHPGTLHKCLHKFPWMVGQVEDPAWLGMAPNNVKLGDISIITDAEEPFLVVGMILTKAVYENPNRSDEYSYFLKAMVRDKIAYSPMPIDQLDEHGANHFKTLFKQIVTDQD